MPFPQFSFVAMTHISWATPIAVHPPPAAWTSVYCAAGLPAPLSAASPSSANAMRYTSSYELAKCAVRPSLRISGSYVLLLKHCVCPCSPCALGACSVTSASQLFCGPSPRSLHHRLTVRLPADAPCLPGSNYVNEHNREVSRIKLDSCTALPRQSPITN